jgi:hypothetical protein
MWVMQIKTWTARGGYEWRSVRRHKKPCVFASKEKAMKELDFYYPTYVYGTEKRVVEEEE